MENIDQKNKDPKCKIFTINKSEKELSCKLEYDINGSEVVCMRCCICKKSEKRIQVIKGFNINWIWPGSKSIKKDRLKSHLAKEKLEQKTTQMKYWEICQLENLYKMRTKDIKSLRIKFNYIYYLAKWEKDHLQTFWIREY